MPRAKPGAGGGGRPAGGVRCPERRLPAAGPAESAGAGDKGLGLLHLASCMLFRTFSHKYGLVDKAGAVVGSAGRTREIRGYMRRSTREGKGRTGSGKRPENVREGERSAPRTDTGGRERDRRKREWSGSRVASGKRATAPPLRSGLLEFTRWLGTLTPAGAGEESNGWSHVVRGSVVPDARPSPSRCYSQPPSLRVRAGWHSP